MLGTDFTEASAVLRKSGLNKPSVIVDLDALDHNIQVLRKTADPTLSWRLVAKSLPSGPLLNYLKEALKIEDLMVFSEPMLAKLLSQPNGDLLLGRPMLIDSVRRVLKQHPNAVHQVQWLIDSTERLSQYDELSKELDVSLRVNLEIDVGLHRGGFTVKDIPRIDALLRESGGLKLAGLMGYEPHLSKLPAILASGAEKRFFRTYRLFWEWANTIDGGLCFNTGGSLTFQRYVSDNMINDISFGSVMVLPSDFEQSSSHGFVPAAYIATPILKVLPGNPWPGLEFLSPFRSGAADVVIQGGYFMGHPVYPARFGYSRLFGRSTNQEIWSGRAQSSIVPGDIALLRPSQSEFVMNSLGPILAYRQGQQLCEWSVLPH